MIGRTISHYRVLALLGRGGMGVVYRAEDERLGRSVALKFLPPDQAQGDAAAARLRREARAASALNHPNICTVYDVGEHEGQHFIAMELVEGQTLGATIAGRPLAVDRVLAIGIEIADALQVAHARGLVHRDLKPGNVLVTPADHVKVLDFGLAKHTDEGAELTIGAALTNPGAAIGTVAYMSPEQARGEPLDHRSDLFSLGLVLYEMATGQVAFSGATTAVIFDALLNRDAPAARSRVADLPVPLDRLITRAMAKRPEERPQHAKDIADELRTIQRGRQPGSGSSGQTAPKPGVSVAVLPFKDLSPAGDQQYFCDGMADEISTALALLGGIQVASRTSAARCQEKGLDVTEIGERLHVQHLVEGSVRKAGNRVRITAQLTSAADGYQLWTERYDRDLDDVFAVQDDIARTIAQRLRVKLAGVGDRPLVRKGTDDPEAYALYLKGRYHWARRNRWRLDAALECFEKAASLDAQYAAPYAGIADCYTVMCIFAVRPGREIVPLALQAVERALSLDPLLGEAHHSSGAASEWIRDEYAGAQAAYRRALDLNPSLAITQAYLATLNAKLRKRADAQKAALAAVTIDPDAAVINLIAGGASYWIDDLDAADRFIQQAIELEPDAPLPHRFRTLLLWRRGLMQEAVTAGERAVSMIDRQPLLLGTLGFAYACAGRTQDGEAILSELTRRAAHEYVAPYWIAHVEAGLGRTDDCLTSLERAYDERNAFVQMIAVDHIFDGVHNHSRFKALLARMNLPE